MLKYKNVNVAEINIVVYLKNDNRGDYRKNQLYVQRTLAEHRLKVDVENPVDDVVYIYLKQEYDSIPQPIGYCDNNLLVLTTKCIQRYAKVYTAAKLSFSEVAINLYLDGFIDGIDNAVDISWDEFLALCNEERHCAKDKA